MPSGEDTDRSDCLEEDIRQAILLILGTNPGECVMEPDFGAGLDAVFGLITPTTLESLRQRVRDALIAWEPRIDVQSVAVAPDPDGGVVRLTTC